MSIAVVELELALNPGHKLEEALSALRRNGLGLVEGLDAVPMTGAGGPSWVVSVNSDLKSAQAVSEAALQGVARVVGVFGSPEGAPFEPW